MGTFKHPITYFSADEQRSQTIEAMVDTGSSYSWAPRTVLRELGILPVMTWPFILPDGRRVLMDMAEVRVELLGGRRTTLVVFGDTAGITLLGAYTLEGFRLAVDPVNRRLVPVDVYALGPRLDEGSS